LRYFFEIAYDGKNYHGWQRQKNAISVQEVVEEALSRITREETNITGSGRTDTGVHCEQQYFHADFTSQINTDRLNFKLNSYLPTDISIQNIRQVKPEAHARFDAISRSYQYRISKSKNPFDREYKYRIPKLPDIKTMNEAASLLIGEHDFESFSKVKTEVNNFVCNISEASWLETERDILFNVTANRFLRGMVRALVGTLLEVGLGKLSKEEFKKVIESKDRRKAGSAAPAHGLFLTAVNYPVEIFL